MAQHDSLNGKREFDEAMISHKRTSAAYASHVSERGREMNWFGDSM